MSRSATAERRSRGRKKIELKKMTSESNLQVTFSKRRTGLFKKASELCTLCGADVALIVFSPGEKAYSFGHPNVDAVIDRFLSGGMPHPQLPSASMDIYEAHRSANVRDLNVQFTRLTDDLEAEKKRSEELNDRRKEVEARCWWAAPIDTMSGDQLATMKANLEELKRKILCAANRTVMQIGSNSNAANPSQLYVGSSSSRQVLPPLQLPPQQVAAMFPPPPPQPLMTQNLVFDGNMMPLPEPYGFQSFHNNMRSIGGYGRQGYY